MPTPRYRQIADILGARIESGELKSGDQLPTEMDLQRDYSASRNTVRDAVKQLIARGLVEALQGQGIFVAQRLAEIRVAFDPENPELIIEEAEYKPTLLRSLPRVEIYQASPLIAEELWLDPGMLVLSHHQQYYFDSLPWSLQTAYFPKRFIDMGAPRLLEPGDLGWGVVDYLHSTLGIEEAGRSDVIRVRRPDEAESAFFKVARDGGVAMLEVRRIRFDGSGQPFMLMTSTRATANTQFFSNFGVVPVRRPSNSPPE